jgi:hypothetical protein
VNSVPQFFVGIQGIKDRKNVNFNLVASPVSDSRHFFVAIGDPQVFNDYSIGRYREVLDFLKGDIASGAINPVHMMVAGDLVFDTPELHGQLKSVSSTVGQPFYYAIGNHDHTRNSTISTSEAWDGMASKVYTGHYGPAWYSFNRGMVHYLVLDDILYRGGPDTEYSVNLTSEQLDWVKKDLACVEKDKVIIVMVHAPTKTKNTSVYGNCDQLHSLLTGYREVHIIAGHKHTNSVVADNSGITEHIVGAACGAWWAGPVCPDGTLLGYKIFEVNGTKVTWKYRAYKYPDRQFSVFKPGPRAAALRPAQELLVNVWDWDRDWSVMWSENNGLTFKDMARITAGAYDPDAYTRYGTDGLLDAELTDHLFTCIPSAGTRRVVIRAINRFKEEYAEIVEW